MGLVHFKIRPDAGWGRGLPAIMAMHNQATQFAATVWAHFTLKPDPLHQLPGTSSEGMGDVVNLRKARKKIERQHAERKAAANRVFHSRSKAERALDEKRNAKSRRDLDRHRVETGDDR